MRLVPLFFLFLLAAAIASGQVSVTGTTPSHNATNVPLLTSVSVTFSGPVDTAAGFNPGDNFFTNVTTALGQSWSADRRTITFQVLLSPSTVYFLLIHSVKPAAGGGFPVPYVFYWTTGTSFPSNLHSISGTISSGSSPVSPDNAIVGLGDTPFTGNDPAFIGGAVTNGAGEFTIPYVADGTWYPLAAKDADLDGEINPTMGDPLAIGDSVVVSGGNITGYQMAFAVFPPIHFAEARDSIIAAAARKTPPNRELRQFYGWGVDSTGAAREWQAYYTVPGNPLVTMLAMESFGLRTDTSSTNDRWVYNSRPCTGLSSAALLDSVVARAERLGGREFRRQAPPAPGSYFHGYARYGPLNNTEFGHWISDTTREYWGLQYTFQIAVGQDSSYSVAYKIFVADGTTGNIFLVTGVGDQPGADVPKVYSLGQNYPNPFNPATTISFSVPTQSRVKIEVFNLLGQKVGTLVNDVRSAGSHQAVWNASVPSGIYFYRMDAVSTDAPSQRFAQVRKMMLVR